MKEKELRQISICGICGKPFGHTGTPSFYRVTIDRYVVDLGAVRRQAGLAMMLENGSLAQVMGPDEDMAHTMGSATLTICESCSMERQLIPALWERR